MPNKWADYAVVGVDYDSKQHYIQCFEVRRDLGEKFDDPEFWSRSNLVNSIEKGTTFVTSTKHPEKQKWQRGDDVAIIVVSSNKYLRTDGNKTTSDNLGNLPRITGKGC